MSRVGRPLGWRKPQGIRIQRQMRAYDDEWELIQRFAKLVKYADKDACQKFVAAQEQITSSAPLQAPKANSAE